MYTHIHIYTYIHIHTRIHTHIYTHTCSVTSPLVEVVHIKILMSAPPDTHRDQKVIDRLHTKNKLAENPSLAVN